MSVGTRSTQNLDAILERLLLPDKRRISPEEANYFLRPRFPSRDVRRMRALTAKAKQGTLTHEEDESLENYIRAGHLLGTLQARARQVRRRSGNVS